MSIRFVPAIVPVALLSALPALAVEARFDDTTYPDPIIASDTGSAAAVVTPEVTYPALQLVSSTTLPAASRGETGQFDDTSYSDAPAPATTPRPAATTVARMGAPARPLGATGR